MLQPPNCPQDGWNYDNRVEGSVDHKLIKRCERLLVRMRGRWFPLLKRAKDTRRIHRSMFRWMAPWRLGYFAGNYRGDARHRCLENYPVFVQGDALVGSTAMQVELDMHLLGDLIEAGASALDSQAALLTPQQHLYRTVEMVTAILVGFLEVHPYADGNGHMGRFIVWAFLLKAGYEPKAWPLEQRPPDPPYSYFLYLYRRGQTDHMHRFMLECIAG